MKSRGFTLLELLIVLLIIGILIAIGLYRYQSVQEAGHDKQAQAALRAAMINSEAVRTKAGSETYADSAPELVTELDKNPDGLNFLAWTNHEPSGQFVGPPALDFAGHISQTPENILVSLQPENDVAIFCNQSVSLKYFCLGTSSKTFEPFELVANNNYTSASGNTLAGAYCALSIRENVLPRGCGTTGADNTAGPRGADTDDGVGDGNNETGWLDPNNDETDTPVVTTPPTWNALGFGGASTYDYISEVDTFSDGSTVVAGRLTSAATFGSFGTVTNTGVSDLLLTRISPTGEFDWVLTAPGHASPRAIDALDDGSTIIVGDINDTTSFGSAGTLLTANGANFVAKVSADGEFVWVKQGQGSSIRDVAALADGSSIISSSFYGSNQVVFGSSPMTATNGQDIIVTKIDANGDFVWNATADGTHTDTSNKLAVNTDGTIALTGYFYQTITFATSGAPTVLTSVGSRDVFVAKLTANGDWIWAKGFGGTGDDLSRGMDVTTNGDIVFAAPVGSSWEVGGVMWAGTGSVRVVKLDSSGDLVWEQTVGGGGDIGSDGLDVRADGSTILGGYFNGSVVFGSTTLSPSNYDVYVAKLSPSGTWEWARKIGGSGADSAYGLASFSDGSIALAGYLSGSVTHNGTTVTSSGMWDNFLTRVDTDGN